MNDSSAPEQTFAENSPSAEPGKPRHFECSLSHKLLALIGTSFLFFQVVFICLYSDNFWFSLNIEWLALPAVLLIGLPAHLFLCFMESGLASRLFRPIKKGLPPVVYRRWLRADESGISFGERHVLWNVIDEMELSWFGNLLLRSRALCGAGAPEPDIILKVPFGVVCQREQNSFVEMAQAHRPGLILNNRLKERIKSPIVKGQNIVQLLTAAMMLLALFDVVHSLFHYLTMLKHYYLAQKSALEPAGKGRSAALLELQQADDLRAHPLTISLVTPQVLKKGFAGYIVLQTRSDALAALGRLDEAIADSRQAIEVDPHAFRSYLHLARLLVKKGDDDAVHQAIDTAIEKHKNSFLPHFYQISSLYSGNPEAARKSYRDALSKWDEKVFGEEPVWPPGGSRYVSDAFFKHDVHFVFDPLLNVGTAESGHDEKAH